MAEKSQAKQQLLHIYSRPDGRHDWHLIVNGEVVAGSQGQGYEHPTEALTMGQKVLTGHFSGAQLRIGGGSDSWRESSQTAPISAAPTPSHAPEIEPQIDHSPWDPS